MTTTTSAIPQQRTAKKLEECTSPSSLVIFFLSNLLLEHLNHPIYSLFRVLQNKCVRSATFVHLNNGRQRNTFWQLFLPTTCWQSMYSLSPPCLVINNCVNNSCRLIQAASKTNSSCKLKFQNVAKVDCSSTGETTLRVSPQPNPVKDV